jgi:fatty acid desaturase
VCALPPSRVEADEPVTAPRPAIATLYRALSNAAPNYARHLRPLLPATNFAPARTRLWWLPFHLFSIGISITAIAAGWVPWPLVPVLSVCIGLSMSGLTFLAHETLHGAVVRSRALRGIVGWFGFLPFTLSPRLWMAWHNRVHHGHTNHSELDPDAFPTLEAYQGSRRVRIAVAIAPGGGRWAWMLPLWFGFTVHSMDMLQGAKRRGYLSPREHRLALLETGLGVAVWIAIAASVGWSLLPWIYLLPLTVANAVVMSFILTNHSLNPLTPKNDPLLNSLSVTLSPLLEWLTLGFGYHVEHHLFPSMSSRHAPHVRDLIRQHWPERYQSMPYGRALRALHHSARVYKGDQTLLDPSTGKEWTTLGAAPDAPGPYPSSVANAGDSRLTSTAPACR